MSVKWLVPLCIYPIMAWHELEYNAIGDSQAENVIGLLQS